MIIEQKIIGGFPHRIGPPPPALHMAPSGEAGAGEILHRNDTITISSGLVQKYLIKRNVEMSIQDQRGRYISSFEHSGSPLEG